MTRTKGQYMKPETRAVWQLLAEAGPKGLSRCGVAARAARSMERSRVCRALNNLVYQGYVQRSEHAGTGRYQTSTYTICLQQLPVWASLPAAWSHVELDTDDSAEDAEPLSTPAEPPTPFPYSVFTFHHIVNGTRPAAPCK